MLHPSRSASGSDRVRVVIVDIPAGKSFSYRLAFEQVRHITVYGQLEGSGLRIRDGLLQEIPAKVSLRGTDSIYDPPQLIHCLIRPQPVSQDIKAFPDNFFVALELPGFFVYPSRLPRGESDLVPAVSKRSVAVLQHPDQFYAEILDGIRLLT